MEDIKSKLFSLSKNDILRGLVMAVITGFFLPVLMAVQTPEFSIFTANWREIIDVAINGAFLGFTTYLFQKFFSDEQGKFGGVI